MIIFSQLDIAISIPNTAATTTSSSFAWQEKKESVL
jgi:hypothetical protein